MKTQKRETGRVTAVNNRLGALDADLKAKSFESVLFRTGRVFGSAQLSEKLKNSKQQKVSDKYIFHKNHKIHPEIDLKNLSFPFVEISVQF